MAGFDLRNTVEVLGELSAPFVHGSWQSTYVGSNHKVVLLSKALLRKVLLNIEGLELDAVPLCKLLLGLVEETSRDVCKGEGLVCVRSTGLGETTQQFRCGTASSRSNLEDLHVRVLVRQEFGYRTELLVHARCEDTLFVEPVQQIVLQPNCQCFHLPAEDSSHVGGELGYDGGIDSLRDPGSFFIQLSLFKQPRTVHLQVRSQTFALVKAVLDYDWNQIFDQVLKIDKLLLCWKTLDLDGIEHRIVIRDVANVRSPHQSQPGQSSLVITCGPVHLQPFHDEERIGG
ncbi:hypothetical protein HG530_010947 [Fusarium avenaceum]|nr:hypothetical protein HG530_010947 [Fusarium avenaceum]